MRKRTIDDPVLDKVLDDVLNDRVSVIPKVADLPRWLREAPSEAAGSKQPWEITQEKHLETYVALAPTQPLFREGLRRLHLELTMNGESIPPALSRWNHGLTVLGDPPPKRGRPRELDRDIKVGMAFKLLGTRQHTREEAIDYIADKMSVSPETIRSVVHKYRWPFRSP